MATPAAPDPIPLLRGVLHQYAFALSLVAGVLLIAGARTPLGYVAASVFAGGVAAMFGASALYHRICWSPATRSWMRRIDHSGIFLMIAGSYTPFGLLALDGAWRIAVLAVVWSSVVAAIAVRLAWSTAPGWLTAVIGVVLGWISLVALPKAYVVLGAAGFALLLAGGIFYTIGSVVHWRGKPDPFPKVFGFHELFHALVVVAVACQYAAFAFFVLPQS